MRFPNNKNKHTTTIIIIATAILISIVALLYHTYTHPKGNYPPEPAFVLHNIKPNEYNIDGQFMLTYDEKGAKYNLCAIVADYTTQAFISTARGKLDTLVQYEEQVVDEINRFSYANKTFHLDIEFKDNSQQYVATLTHKPSGFQEKLDLINIANRNQ